MTEGETDDDAMDMGFLVGLAIPDKSPPGKVNMDALFHQWFPQIGHLFTLGNRVGGYQCRPNGRILLHQRQRLLVPTGDIIHIPEVLPLAAKDRRQILFLLRRHDPSAQEGWIPHDVVEPDPMEGFLLSAGMDLDIRAVQVHASIPDNRILQYGRREFLHRIDMGMIRKNDGIIPNLFP